MRRHLLVPGSGEAPDAAAIAHRVGGLQAQVATGPLLSVRARGGGGLDRMVRMWTLRGTVHLVAEPDVSLFASAAGASVAARETRLWPKQGVPATAEGKVTGAILAALADGPLDCHAIAAVVGDRFGPAYRTLLDHPWGIGFKPAVARALPRMEGSGTAVRFRRPDVPVARISETVAQQQLAHIYLTANEIGLTIDGRECVAIGWEPDAEPPVGRVSLPAFDPYTSAVVDKAGFCDPVMQARIWKKGGWMAPITIEKGVPLDGDFVGGRL